MSDTQNPDARTCAWTGEPFTGKGYILRTTEHPEEIVSADALRHDGAKTDEIARQVKALAARVTELERDKSADDGKEQAPRRPRKTAAAKVASHPEGA